MGVYMVKNKMSIQTLVICGVFAAILAVICPLSIPIGPVPITLGTFSIALTGYVLGGRYGCITTGIYILIGAVGLPVFSGYKGGLNVIIGVTGGFIFGYLILSYLCGFDLITKKFKLLPQYIIAIFQGLVGLVLLYLLGMVQFVFITEATMSYAFAVCVAPFIVKDVISIIIAFILGNMIKKALVKSRLLLL